MSVSFCPRRRDLLAAPWRGQFQAELSRTGRWMSFVAHAIQQPPKNPPPGAPSGGRPHETRPKNRPNKRTRRSRVGGACGVGALAGVLNAGSNQAIRMASEEAGL